MTASCIDVIFPEHATKSGSLMRNSVRSCVQSAAVYSAYDNGTPTARHWRKLSTQSRPESNQTQASSTEHSTGSDLQVQCRWIQVLLFVSIEFLKCRLLKLLLAHPMNIVCVYRTSYESGTSYQSGYQCRRWW